MKDCERMKNTKPLVECKKKWKMRLRVVPVIIGGHGIVKKTLESLMDELEMKKS